MRDCYVQDCYIWDNYVVSRHFVIVPNVTIPNVTIPNVTIPKLVKIPNINRNPASPPTKLGEGEVLSSYPDLA
jgi:hypothetical protein